MVRPHVRKRIPPPYAEHHFYLLFQLVRAGPVALIDHIQVRNFHYPRFQGLDAVARFWNEDQDGRFRRGRHIELGLTHADRFDENTIEAERLEDVGDFLGRRREAALGAPGGHRTDEHPRIETDGLHANAVAEERAPGKGTGRIDGDHADLEAALAIGTDELFGERALARARRSRYPDALSVSLTDPGMQLRQDAFKPFALILDETDGAGQRGRVAARQSLEHRIDAHML